MSIYSASTTATVANTTNDLLSITPSANMQIQIVEIAISGQGTASSASQINLYTVTTVGATGSGAITPSVFSPYAPAAGSTAFTGWTTQPTVGTILIPMTVNANGGIYRWVARPGEEIYCINAATTGAVTNKAASIRASVNNGGVYTISIVWVENPF